MKKRLVARAASAVACSLLLVSHAVGADWASGLGGSWTNEANWSTGAVPPGNTALFFTNAHSGTIEVSLDGDRSQNGRMTFDGGDWLFAPGTPSTSAFTNVVGNFLVEAGNTVTFAVPVQLSNTAGFRKDGDGELVLESTFRQGSGQNFGVFAGMTRVGAGGAFYMGENSDLFVDGTSTFEVDGGYIGARLIRMSQNELADGAVFRMTSGTVNAGGFGSYVIIIGYGAGPKGEGSARAEILGGTFTATGLVENAYISIGSDREGTLVVDGPTAVLDVSRIYWGWRDNGRGGHDKTNRFHMGNGAKVYAHELMARAEQMGYCEAYLEAGGELFTPMILCAAGSHLAMFWSGTTWTQSSPTNALFIGNVTVNLSGTDSTLVIPSGTTDWIAPVSGGGWLRKTGGGTLRMRCDQSAWTGGMELAEGDLDVSGGMLNVPLVVTSADSTLVASNATLNALTLMSGAFVLEGDLFIGELEIPTGESVQLDVLGTVTIARLTGDGTLAVDGGGSVSVMDASGFTGIKTVDPGTGWDDDSDTVPEIVIRGAMTLTLTQNTTVERVSFVGDGTLTVAGGHQLDVGEITLVPNVTGTLVFDSGTPSTVAVGSLNGTGTLTLPDGKLIIAELGSGVNFDLLAGEIEVAMLASSQTPPVFETPPAFWVDATDTASMTLSGSTLTQWRDKRFAGGEYVNFATAGVNAPVLLAPSAELNGNAAVRFAFPATGNYSGMEWNERLENVRSAFFVIGAQEGGGQLLGDSTTIDYLRGEVINGTQHGDYPQNTFATAIFSQRFFDGNRDGIRNVVNGVTRLNGVQRNFRQTSYPSAAYHLVSLRTLGDTCAKAFASERTVGQNARSGCQRLAEVLVFTNAVDHAEMEAIEAYLTAKWFGGGVRVGRVRLGSPGARFGSVNTGALVVDTVEVAAAGVDVTTQVTGVKKIDTVVVTAPTFAVPPAMLPESASPSAVVVNELRLENGAVVSADTSSVSGTVRLWTLSGDGTLNVTGAGRVYVPGLKTGGGGQFALNTPPVLVEVNMWASRDGILAIGGCSNLRFLMTVYAQQGRSGVTYAGVDELLLQYANIEKTGVAEWAHTGNINASGTGFLLIGTNPSVAFDFDTGGKPFRINTLTAVSSSAVTRIGPDTLHVNSHIQVENPATFTLDPLLFTGGYLSELRLLGGTVNITGGGPLVINTFRTINNATTFRLVPEAAVTVSNFLHTIGTFYYPAQDNLNVLTLSPSDNCMIVVPTDTVRVVNALNVIGGNRRFALSGGVLQILDSVSALAYIISAQGIIFPDGTLLNASQLDIRSDTMLDVGVTGVLTVDVATSLTNALTLAKGSLYMSAPLDAPALTLADGAVMDIAAGQTVTVSSLTGNSTITLGAGAVLDVLSSAAYFDGTIVNNGGTVNTTTTRLKVVPMEPVVEPTFWVDASQEGSFWTNANNHLVWLDKRTARDGTPGLMSAVSTNKHGKIPEFLPNQLNGLPVIDFGTLGIRGQQDEKGMGWSQRLTNVRAVHWVIGVQNGGGQMLGDYNGGHIDYFRFNDDIESRYSDYTTPLWSGVRFYTREFVANVVNGVTCMNGEVMTAPGTTQGFPSPDYHLLSLRTTGPTWAAAFASERIDHNSTGEWAHRSGGQRLGEVLVYDSVTLTEEEQEANDVYLRWKWWGERLFAEDYRLPTEDLLVLKGNGTFNGASVLARELEPGLGGMSFAGSLYLDFYPDAVDVGTVIRLDTLPAPGIAAISALGDIHLSTHGTIILGEIKPGSFKVLEAGGDLLNATNLANWTVDTSAFANVSGYNVSLVIENDCVMLNIRAKGTVILLR